MKVFRELKNGRIVTVDLTVTAVWHTAYFDIPVEVIKYLGPSKDGTRFYLVKNDKGEEVGVPFNELKDIKSQ